MTKKVITLSSETEWRNLATKLFRQFKQRIKETGYKQDSEHLKIFFGEMRERKDINRGQENLVLLNWPDRLVDSLEVVQLMNEQKIRPVSLLRFLYLGQENAELIQLVEKSLIITFGSFWRLNDTIFVPAFWKNSYKHSGLVWLSELWGSRCWFVGLVS